MKQMIIAFASISALLIVLVQPLCAADDVRFNKKVSMEITVVPTKDTLSASEKQELTVSFKNTSSQTITIPTFTYNGQTAYSYLAGFVLGFVIYRIEGPQRIPVQVAIFPPIIKGLPVPCPKDLKPGESWTVIVDLATWLWLAGDYVQKPDPGAGGRLTPGEYEISAVYDISKWSTLTGHDKRYGFVEDKFTSAPVKVAVH